jgi:N-acetylmuramoyl-L-alanine amidase
LRHKAAKTWPILRVFFASLLALSFFPLAARADNNTPARREAAKNQFARAETNRQALEARPESVRTLKDYTSLVNEYQRVYLITPHAADVPAALNEVAELYRTMGDLFDEKYYERSISSYQFLMREYPASKYREGALLAIAHIEQDDQHDAILAQKSYEQFLALHPRSSHAAEVRAILGKLAAETASAKPPAPRPAARDRSGRVSPRTVSADKIPPATDTRKPGSSEGAPASGGSVPEVSRIRTWNADTYTRIVIDVGSKVKYQAARISGPDRIYFDIEGAKLTPSLLHEPIDIEGGGYLKTIRVAQNQSDVVRVVLEVNRVQDYSVFLLPNPYRLVVDVYGTTAAAEAAARRTSPPPGPTTTDAPPPVKTDKPAGETAAKASAASRESAKGNETAPGRSTRKPEENEGRDTLSASSKGATPGSDPGGPAARAEASPSVEESAPPAHASIVKKPGRAAKSAHEQAEEMGPPPTPDLTRDGQHSLTRALGLKVGRIVIDAGHGGHDTGTIGPTGLMEKDLCLDVSLRLGKLIQQRLPGTEVVYTRDDDTYIPLERRTEIANDAKADLFLSIHANSSQDRHARGIETYYLNFTGSSDAMEVASRENALSDNAVHDLQDIVKKIARNEKIEESRDFATMIQDSLTKRVEIVNRGDHDRGVRKAPFVVLIGANMPSVLAEISFLSNPSDEQWLKKPDNRQRVADGLYRGIVSYLQSTNSLASNQNHSGAENRAGTVARSGNSQ